MLRRTAALFALLASCRHPSGGPPLLLLDAAPPPAPPQVAAIELPPSIGTAPPTAPSTSIPDAAVARTPHVTDWCIEGMDALDDETCFVLPQTDAGERRLLIYLHGIVPPQAKSDQKRLVETVVMSAATRAGYAAMIPRGRRGIGPGFAKDWWAWPTTSSDYAKYAKQMIASFLERRTALEAIAGGRFKRTYLAGSSNGAYFATSIALRGAMDIDGFGAMSGGSGAGTLPSALAALPARAFYVGIPTYDTTNADGKTLAALLDATKWPHKVAEHPLGHGAKEIYLDEAFAFWDAEAAKNAGDASAASD